MAATNDRTGRPRRGAAVPASVDCFRNLNMLRLPRSTLPAWPTAPWTQAQRTTATIGGQRPEISCSSGCHLARERAVTSEQQTPGTRWKARAKPASMASIRPMGSARPRSSNTPRATSSRSPATAGTGGSPLRCIGVVRGAGSVRERGIAHRRVRRRAATRRARIFTACPPASALGSDHDGARALECVRESDARDPLRPLRRCRPRVPGVRGWPSQLLAVAG